MPSTEPSSSPIPVLMNVHAGTLHGPLGAKQLTRMAQEVGFEIQVIQTHTIDEMRSEVKRLVDAKTPRVGIAGGDGTVEATVQELAHTETALGILSQGTFNNFASSLRLPHNLPAALKVLHTGTVTEIDLGCIEGHGYFTESAGIGLFADGLALYGHGSGKKSVFRGVVTAARMALSFGARDMTLTVDGETLAEKVVLCEIANTFRIAQADPIAPYAALNDGILEVVIFGDVKRKEFPAYFKALRAQMHIDLPKVKTLRAHREIRIETPRPRNVHSDDQVIGTTPVTITVERGALKVITDTSREL